MKVINEEIKTEEEFAQKCENSVAYNRKFKEEIEKDIYAEAVNEFGSDLQTFIAIEELSELIKALTKEIRIKSIYKTGLAPFIINIAEEMADVEIMLSQLRVIFKKECEEFLPVSFEEYISNFKEDKLLELNFRIRDHRNSKADLLSQDDNAGGN